ncbi:hypothetical protein [Nocardiopsis ganjiahuensis]|uniref:hypothetical protein n=1 Tax=Nocardiopsis ganjiahuensis TaxID=239984 RepID=UPI0019553865|nr:hypothetical protein [Nocardiopsis ganjiahuensis]
MRTARVTRAASPVARRPDRAPRCGARLRVRCAGLREPGAAPVAEEPQHGFGHGPVGRERALDL